MSRPLQSAFLATVLLAACGGSGGEGEDPTEGEAEGEEAEAEAESEGEAEGEPQVYLEATLRPENGSPPIERYFDETLEYCPGCPIAECGSTPFGNPCLHCRLGEKEISIGAARMDLVTPLPKGVCPTCQSESVGLGIHFQAYRGPDQYLFGQPRRDSAGYSNLEERWSTIPGDGAPPIEGTLTITQEERDAEGNLAMVHFTAQVVVHEDLGGGQWGEEEATLEVQGRCRPEPE